MVALLGIVALLVMLLVASGAIAFRRCEAVLFAWMASRERIAQVQVDIAALMAASTERIAAMDHEEERNEVRAVASEIVIPDDLEAHVNSWSDEFARDDERAAIRHRYLEFHTGDADVTWQKVRRSFGLGELP